MATSKAANRVLAFLDNPDQGYALYFDGELCTEEKFRTVLNSVDTFESGMLENDGDTYMFSGMYEGNAFTLSIKGVKLGNKLTYTH